MKKTKIFILTIFVFISGYINAQENLDSLQQSLYEVLNDHHYDSTTITFVNHVFNENIDINVTRASEVSAIGLQIANEIGDSLLIAQMQNLRGISILKQKTYFMAIQIFFDNLTVFRKYNSKKDMANTLLFIAQAYLEQGIPDIAGDKVQDAIEIYRKIDDSIGVANSYQLLGLSYMFENEEKAIEYYLRSEDIYVQFASEFNLAKTYLLLGKAYLSLEKTDFALDYFTKAKTIFTSLNKNFYVAEALEAIGDAYYFDLSLSNARNSYQKSKEIFDRLNQLRKMTEVDIKLAQVVFSFENFFLSASIADSARINAEILNDYELMYQAYKLLSESYQQINDLKTAIEYEKLYAQALKSYYEQKSSSDFSLFQMNLETQNQETEIEVLKMISEQEKLQLQNKQYKRTKIFVLLIFLLFTLFIFYIVYRSRERKKAAIVLKRSNNRLKQEIEERKKAEFISRSNEKQYELVFSQTPVGILQFDENMLISNVNDRFVEIFHKSKSEINKKHLNTIFDRNTIHKISHLFDSKEEMLKLRNEIPTKKEVVFVSLTVKKYRLWVKDDEVVGGIAIVQDFTEEKKAERYYKANIKLKQMLVKQIPDDIILLDEDENILEIHFPDAPEREVGISKLEDIFKDSTLSLFRTHLINSRSNKRTSQFFFSDNSNNYLVRVIPSEESSMIIISRFEGEAQDAGIIIKEQTVQEEKSVDKYLKNIQEDIENQLLPIYQNIQRGLSFIMIKNFAEKIVELGINNNNNKIKDYGEELLDHVTSFNVFKVNEILNDFPSFISQFMGISRKF